MEYYDQTSFTATYCNTREPATLPGSLSCKNILRRRQSYYSTAAKEISPNPAKPLHTLPYCVGFARLDFEFRIVILEGPSDYAFCGKAEWPVEHRQNDFENLLFNRRYSFGGE